MWMLRLTSARSQANDLIAKWPKADDLDFTSNGECRGIILAGIAFLEGNRSEFPDTYAAAKALIERFGLGEPSEDFQDRQNLEEATGAMIQLLSTLPSPRN